MKVHHIDPQGEDSGVVYSEMQGRENTSGDLMSLQYVPGLRDRLQEPQCLSPTVLTLHVIQGTTSAQSP